MDGDHFGDFEYERRFFVRELPTDITANQHPSVIIQAYLLAADGYAVRIRGQASDVAELPAPTDPSDQVLAAIAPHFNFCALTAKGPYVGGTRYEAERELDASVCYQMLKRAGARITKLRYSAWLGEDGWVIDQFLGANAPLIIAECERGGPVVDLAIPAFCFHEVTADHRFSNDYLSGQPYRQWAYHFEEELAVSGPSFITEFGTNTHLQP
ncbi:MAG: adenylate cyclase [Bowdeniella nasicola]|nr:adenylate cyclase [Bowdeniella nasicola]